MIVPNRMCRPPNPAPSHKSAQTIEVPGSRNNASAPSARKHSPITGIAGTENAPPVITPVPYNISHSPGIEATAPAFHNAAVSTAPANSGGTKLKMNLRAGADHSGNPADCALRHMANTPTAIARMASPSHNASQVWRDAECDAKPAAASAVTPISMPPQPGTAVNEPARSIVSRIYRRLSSA